MPLIPFPHVPPAAGVPALLAQVIPGAGQVVAAITLLTGDDPLLSGLTSQPQWGIFDADGNPVVVADSVISLEYKKEFRVSTFPVEEGSFATYNKVEEPRANRLELAKGGGVDERSAFLDALEAVEASLDFYTILSPERAYLNSTVREVSYARHAQGGATLILAEVAIEEVRIAASAQFSKTASPAGANSVSGGTVLPQPPSTTQSAAAAGGET